MLRGIGRDVRIVAISVITSAVLVGAPATAAVIASNSDKVDGKHAVGAKADAVTRAGKLVATNKAGLFPNDILAKALDADQLDGMDSADFLAVGGTAVDAQLLDGKDSTDFLGATGKATDADKIDGVDSTDLVRGGGMVVARSGTAALGESRDFFVTSDQSSGARGYWYYMCPTDPNSAAFVLYYNLGTSPTDVYVSRLGSTGTYYEKVPANGHMFIRDAAPIDTGDIFTWSFHTPGKNLLVTAQFTSRRTAQGCTITSQAVESPLQ